MRLRNSLLSTSSKIFLLSRISLERIEWNKLIEYLLTVLPILSNVLNVKINSLLKKENPKMPLKKQKMERKLIKNTGKNMQIIDFFVLIVKLNNVKLVKQYPII
jgi:hypothetical protein